MFLAQRDRGTCWSPRRLAELLGESPTYLAKVVRYLVRTGLLEAEKGAKGGVRLVKNPAVITLLEVVEACQGTIVGDYCRSPQWEGACCNFHQAATELHDAIVAVLRSWTLARLLEYPFRLDEVAGGAACLMARGRHAPPEQLTRIEVGR